MLPTRGCTDRMQERAVEGRPGPTSEPGLKSNRGSHTVHVDRHWTEKVSSTDDLFMTVEQLQVSVHCG